MGASESKGTAEYSKQEDYLGNYGDAPDSINPIYRDREEGHIVVAAGERFDIGSVIDELRRKKTGRRTEVTILKDEAGEAGESSSSSEDSELRLGKLHREREQRKTDEEYSEAVSKISGATENSLIIEEDPIPLNILKLRDLSGKPTENQSIKWYLSDDFGAPERFQVNAISEGVLCRVPLPAIGRYIKAVETRFTTQWHEKGYEATVGEAFNPLTNERIQQGRTIRVTSAATVGPVTLPAGWFDQYYEIIYGDAALETFDFKLEKHRIELALDGSSVTLNGTTRALPEFLTKTDQGWVANLSDLIVKLEATFYDEALLKLEPTSASKGIQLRPAGETDVIFVWGLINCIQAAQNEKMAKEMTKLTMVNQESGEYCEHLLQAWLVANSRYNLVGVLQRQGDK